MSERLAVVVLAAGAGTRMVSKLPKVLHEVAGRSMVGHVLKAARALEPERIVVVTGRGADQVEDALAGTGLEFARQEQQLGTGHAFLQAATALAGFKGDILVLYGDTPLLRQETLAAVVNHHRETSAGMTVITAELANPTGYGRIIRGSQGEVLRIVEEKAATPAQRLVKETNSGVYVFDHHALELAGRIGNDNPSHEYYLTDILEEYLRQGLRTEAFQVPEATELMGVNDRLQLAFAEGVLQARTRERLMRGGVTLRDPASTFVDDTVEVEPDVTLEPGVHLRGSTRIGRGSSIGPDCLLRDATLDENVLVAGWTVVEGASLAPGATVGPFARLRAGAVLKDNTHVGNFVEVKNSTLEAGVKAGHLAYLGDALIREEANIGAGTII
ncbi:MAG TPA: bifunctional UDP-N-acetylglucosamine diphosphorylase/glucosamine-1-phosphate N-acetyltransferase GlmU, partial [Deinococcales bacterium]|nr:bifunctional UDP-N-acetylglucosamine diphosphorylase/glucosamine-1-phosphate N-acetyltransferase GlmU [Deinococcales bacterium]